MGTSLRTSLVVATLACASACGTSSKTSVNAPTTRCGVTATAQPAAVGAPGGSGTIVITTDRECAWEARSEADWLALAGSTGQGDGTVRYTAAGNSIVSERRAAVVVNGLRVEIGQAAAACTFSLDRSERSVDAAGGSHDVAVSAQAGCAWTTASDVPWITSGSGASGQGPGRVVVLVQVNAALTARRGTITIAGQPYSVEQAAASANPLPTPPVDPACRFTVSPLASSVGTDGGSLEVAVTTSAPTCAWTAASAVSWISMEGGVSEAGPGRRRFVVAPNTTTTSRAGSLIVAGAVVTVTQAAANTPPPPPVPVPVPCTFSVAPTSGTVPAEGGGGDIVVTASAPTCAWTSAPAVSWITINGAAGTTGSGGVRYAVSANSATTPRSGTLVVAGVTVTITQAAAAPPPCNYSVTPLAFTLGFAGDGDTQIQISTGSGCAWTATSQASWITVTSGASGTGNGTASVAVPANPLVSGRTGTVLVAGQTVTVTQGGLVDQEVTLTGTISNLSGSCPNRTFTLDGRTIVANGSTSYQGNDDCGDLRNGRSARVRGRGQADGSILANRIDRIDDNLMALPRQEDEE